jgi:hypothetical protein
MEKAHCHRCLESSSLWLTHRYTTRAPLLASHSPYFFASFLFLLERLPFMIFICRFATLELWLVELHAYDASDAVGSQSCRVGQ